MRKWRIYGVVFGCSKCKIKYGRIAYGTKDDYDSRGTVLEDARGIRQGVKRIREIEKSPQGSGNFQEGRVTRQPTKSRIILIIKCVRLNFKKGLCYEKVFK